MPNGRVEAWRRVLCCGWDMHLLAGEAECAGLTRRSGSASGVGMGVGRAVSVEQMALANVEEKRRQSRSEVIDGRDRLC